MGSSPIAWTPVVIWSVIGIGAAYLSVGHLMRWSTDNTISRLLGIVMGLLCIAAVIHVGVDVGWWSFIYKPGK